MGNNQNSFICQTPQEQEHLKGIFNSIEYHKKSIKINQKHKSELKLLNMTEENFTVYLEMQIKFQNKQIDTQERIKQDRINLQDPQTVTRQDKQIQKFKFNINKGIELQGYGKGQKKLHSIDIPNEEYIIKINPDKIRSAVSTQLTASNLLNIPSKTSLVKIGKRGSQNLDTKSEQAWSCNDGDGSLIGKKESSNLDQNEQNKRVVEITKGDYDAIIEFQVEKIKTKPFLTKLMKRGKQLQMECNSDD